jgi:hypothetical protein
MEIPAQLKRCAKPKPNEQCAPFHLLHMRACVFSSCALPLMPLNLALHPWE